MKKTKITAFLSAFTMSAVTVLLPLNNIYAENASPLVYGDFNTNDVNGTVTVNIPEDTSAEVKITFTSPEVTDEPYYIKTLTGGDSYSFDIEGRDTTENDYRNYTLSVALTGGQYQDTAVYTDNFTVPDGNDNPDSFMKCDYNFSLDNEYTGNEWDVSSETETEKNIVFHLNAYTMGDLNNDALIDAVDSSLILTEYALLSTGGEGTFSKRQNLAGDVNKDGFIDAVDASQILIYYAELSTGGNPSWDNINDTSSTTATTAITSTYTTTAPVDTTTETTTTTTTTAPLSIDYSSYAEAVNILESAHDDSILFSNYYIYDMNNDGIYELITEMGTCEADNEYSVYTMKNNEMTFVGEVPATHSILHEKDGKLYRNYTHTGYQSVIEIDFDGNSITTQTIYEKEQSETYIEYGTKIESYDWSDMSGINSITNTDITTTTTQSETSSSSTTTTATSVPQNQLDNAMKKAVASQPNLRNPQYCYDDINGDNIPELFICAERESGTFIDMYIYKNNEFAATNKSGGYIYVCHEKNLLRMKANEGAAVDLFYAIKEDGTPELIDSLSIYSNDYYHNDSIISKEEYTTREAEYDAMSWTELEYKQVQLYEGCPNIQNAPSDMVYYSQPIIGIVNIDSGTLNMRTGAGTNYSIIMSLQKDTEVQILGAGNGWCYVKYSSGGSESYGYMSMEFLKYTNNSVAPTTTTTTTTTTTNTTTTTTNTTTTTTTTVTTNEYFQLFPNNVFCASLDLIDLSPAQVQEKTGINIPEPQDFPYWGVDLKCSDIEVDGFKVGLLFQYNKLAMICYDTIGTTLSDSVTAPIINFRGTANIDSDGDKYWNYKNCIFEVFSDYYSNEQQYGYKQRYVSNTYLNNVSKPSVSSASVKTYDYSGYEGSESRLFVDGDFSYIKVVVSYKDGYYDGDTISNNTYTKSQCSGYINLKVNAFGDAPMKVTITPYNSNGVAGSSKVYNIPRTSSGMISTPTIYISTVNNRKGQINTHGGTIAGFASSYVCNGGSVSKIRSSLGNRWHVTAVRECYNYSIHWYELYDSDDGDYYGWVDADYIDFYN